jgi:hypothetical protein
MASEAGNTSVMMTVATSGEEQTCLDPVCEPRSQNSKAFHWSFCWEDHSIAAQLLQRVPYHLSRSS